MQHSFCALWTRFNGCLIEPASVFFSTASVPSEVACVTSKMACSPSGVACITSKMGVVFFVAQPLIDNAFSHQNVKALLQVLAKYYREHLQCARSRDLLSNLLLVQ